MERGIHCFTAENVKTGETTLVKEEFFNLFYPEIDSV